MDEYRIQADFFKALAHPLALKVLNVLANNNKCVCEMAESIGEGQPQVSRVLSRLKKAGLVELSKNGVKACYRIKSPEVKILLEISAAVIKQETESIMQAMKKKKGGF